MSKLSETVERKFIDSITLDDEWEIESDAGWVPVTHIHKTIQYTEWIVITQNNQLICADTHILFDENLNEVFVCDLIPNKSYVMTRTGPELVQELHQTSNQSNMFDITVDSDDHRFYSGEFLSHNTTTSVAYLLWLTLFTDTQTVAVLANKGSLARDILAKYQLAYENLPMWLQQGVVTWNKGNVELENGSKIIAASTSSSAIRGGSFNCVSGKSMTRISVGGKEIEISMEDLYSKITNSSKYTLYDNKKQGCLEYVSREQRYKNEEILILTEEGYKPFCGIKKTENQKTIKLVFDNGQNIICTPEHKIFTKNGYVFAKDCLNLKCLGHDGNFCGVHTITENESIDVYDLLEVQDTHSYYCNDILVHQCVFLDEFGFVPNNIAEEFFNSVYPVISSGKTSKIIIVSTPNGMNLFYKLWMDAINGKNNYKTFEIHWSMVPGRDEAWKEETIRNTSERQFSQEFNCEFLGSSNTLISGRKLQQIAHRDPSFVHDMVRIYESPVKEDGEKNLKDHLYCIMVDVAEGKGLDSSAFQVIDMTAMPYRQVAAYNSSSISPILFPTVIYNTARLYNDAYILVEVNNTNQIAETLHADFEYENLWKVHTGNKKPQQLSTGFARGVQMGVKMSPQVKRIGCTNLRSLVEADKLILQDFNTYSELTTFIAQKNSWSAESGANDDMVMCLVMFAWVTTQKYFREIVNHDIRKQMQLENMNQIDEITPPEMIVEDGLSHGFAVMGGDVWEDAHSGGTYQNWVNDALKQF